MKQNKKIRGGKYTPHFCLVDIIKKCKLYNEKFNFKIIEVRYNFNLV